jgi:hypothetical protein
MIASNFNIERGQEAYTSQLMTVTKLACRKPTDVYHTK